MMMEANCPNCQNAVTFSEESEKVICSHCGHHFDNGDKTRILTGAPLKSTELETGEKLGRYEIEKFLGRGGMGTVYQAYDPSLKRSVALKLLNTEFAQQESFIKRFDREAENLARLKHAGVVKVLDRGFDRSWPYLVMELVEGQPLRQEMNKGAMPLNRILAIISDLSETLEYSHACGVVHRDIKPENILIDEDDQKPKLTDFGLSKTLQNRVVETRITMTNILMGTLDYMAPEQRRNKGEVNHQSDIYSLGVVFYEMLTNNLPVGAFEMPSELNLCPKWVDGVLKKMLATDPGKRYADATQLLKDLRQQPHTSKRKPADVQTPVTEGFNWIAILQMLLFLLVIVAEFPFTWMLTAVVLLAGLRSYRKEKFLFAQGEMTEEELQPRFIKLSVSYWISLIALVLLCQPYRANWIVIEELMQEEGEEISLTRSKVENYVMDFKRDLEAGRFHNKGIALMIAMLAMPLFIIFFFSSKKRRRFKEQAAPVSTTGPPPEKVRLPGLYRDTSNCWLGGVCSGLAHKTNLTVGGLRLVTFVLLIATISTAVPVVILIYLLAWVLIPGVDLSQYEARRVLKNKGSTGCATASLVAIVLAIIFFFVFFMYSVKESQSFDMIESKSDSIEETSGRGERRSD
jgi:tRNA A-37 threonylcarbamoyl transferase component Bud32/phage shock protein PspC (stress-responsive transcriptional regulator)